MNCGSHLLSLGSGKKGQALDLRASGGSQWQLDCNLPFERQLNIGFSSSRQPRVKCGLLVDCPAYY
ncbi:MAG: hypothetical protein FWD08_02685, partial [Alphaproteobacteria bacterium]|nr:hypothetical protein [Alphaproteobacteria bacterium]